VDLNKDRASNIIDAVKARSVTGNVPFMLLAKAIQSALADGADVASSRGISWREGGEDGGAFNSLLKTERGLIHAIVRDGTASATVYSSRVGAVEAAGVEELQGFGQWEWRVNRWHVTLMDGTVITLESLGGSHAYDLAEFVRSYLLPG
jgi:hypothetical protein